MASRTTINLSPELLRDLVAASRRLHRSQSDIVRDAVAAYLRTVARPLPRSLGVASDDLVTGETSEAWLREHWGREHDRGDRG